MMRSRETRERWPLLTVGTEVNGDSKSTNEWGPFLGWLVGLVVPVQEIFFSPYTISIPLSPSASKLCTVQAAMLGRLSLSMCL